MITLNKGLTNSVVLRLNDNVTISSPKFLFEFQSVQSKELFYCIPQDISTTTRYNQFSIWEIGGTTQSISLTASTPQIEFTYGGVYNYKIYEKSDYTLATSSTVVDEGKMTFLNGEIESFFFEIDDTEISNVFDIFGVTGGAFNFEDTLASEVFDPEFQYDDKALITQDRFIFQTQNGDTIIWR